MNFFGQNPQFTLGEFVYKKRGTFGPRIQKNLQLVYIYEGSAEIKVNGSLRKLASKRATLLIPGREEYFAFSTKQKTRHGWCESLSPELDPDLIRAYDELPTDAPFTPRMEELVALAFPLEGRSDLPSRQLHDSLALAIFWEYLLHAGFRRGEAPLPIPLQRAVDHIHTRYANVCNLRILAKVAGLSGAHLIRLFRKKLGVTPIDYLWKIRTDAGAKLLVETGLPIAEIAYRTGFQNPYHFSRVFRRYLRHTPREHRKNAWTGK